MAAKESKILKEIILAYSRAGSRIFRCNSGSAWVGKSHRLTNGDMLIKSPRIFRSGWPVGTSDLIGFTTKIVTPEMVGKPVAIFTAIEVKTGRLKPTEQQSNFIKTVNDHGGNACVAYGLQDITFINKYTKEKTNGI